MNEQYFHCSNIQVPWKFSAQHCRLGYIKWIGEVSVPKQLWIERKVGNYALGKQHQWLKYLLKHCVNTVPQWHSWMEDQQMHQTVWRGWCLWIQLAHTGKLKDRSAIKPWAAANESTTEEITS